MTDYPLIIHFELMNQLSIFTLFDTVVVVVV